MANNTEERTTTNWMKEAQKGYIRIGVLILLNKKPSHGYELMKQIKDRTKGFWHPTAGGIYPILRDLEDAGYIKGEWQAQKNRKLKVYKITESGELILKRAIVKQTELADSIKNLFQEFARGVLNVETTNMPAPPEMPPPFLDSFLENKQNSEMDLNALENERKHILEAVKMMKNKLKLINRKIIELKKEKTT